MRGYFGIGAEGISKPMNLGNLMRSAHAFGASFVFTVGAHHTIRDPRSDTSKTSEQLPYYAWETVADMALPRHCQLVGIELTGDAIELPSFRHPRNAAYVLGPEMGELSEEMLQRADFVVKIPTRFCINVQIAGAVVMYDRVKSLGQFAERPVMPGGPTQDVEPHVRGRPRERSVKK